MASIPPAFPPGMAAGAPPSWAGMPMPFIISFIMPGGGILPGGMDPEGALPPWPAENPFHSSRLMAPEESLSIMPKAALVMPGRALENSSQVTAPLPSASS